MIVGIGTDIVKIDRLATWQSFSPQRLQKIFSIHELDCCSDTNGLYDTRCLAVRFAAKEAFYKALSQALLHAKLTQHSLSFLFVCKHVDVLKLNEWGVPELHINWSALENALQQEISPLHSHISLSHEKDYAIAFVTLSR